MGSASSIVFSGIAPHPPIMVPEVGGESAAEVAWSIEAMAELTRRIIASGAESIILISPHAPLQRSDFVAYDSPAVRADFAAFRAPQVEFELSLDTELLQAISRSADGAQYHVVPIHNPDLDHGTAVPLYFLRQNGWTGRVVALGYSFLSNEDHLRFGSCIAKAIDETGRSVALIASGDLSHRLKLESPAGFNPTAYIFDDEIVDALRSNTPERIVNIDQDLRSLAGECGYRSMLIVLGATSELPRACEVLSYEAPFGVGYLVAQLTNKVEGSAAIDSLPALAREAVESFIRTGTVIRQKAGTGLLAARAACFVSLKTLDGELRGCIGTVEPVKDTLAAELIANAINAATRDSRFSPVTPDELPNLRYSVDVLSAPEPAEITDLDPAVYGVIVEDETGSRRGLLLPDLQGIETVSDQVAIASRKAGILPGDPVRLARFRVDRYGE